MTDSLSLEEIRQLEERLKAKQLRALPGRLGDKSKVVSWGHMAPLSELVSLEEVRQVANKLKQRRVIWGLTQGQLGELICYKYGARLSQTTVSRFEMMDCTVATARRLFRPMKEMLELIDEIFEKNGSQHTDALCNLVKTSIGEILPTTKERKKRVTYTDEQLNALDALFKQCDSPSSAQLNRFAQTLGLSFPEVRVWFCNRRQKRRKTISPESLESGETEEEILARWEEKNKRKTVRSELQKQEAEIEIVPLFESLDKMPKEEIVIKVSQKA